MRLKRTAIVFVAVSITCGSAFAESNAARQYLAKYDVPAPTPTSVVVCHGFNCKYRTLVGLGAGDIGKLREILARGRGSARSEINAIADAVAWFERRIGQQTGTSRRTPRAGPAQAGLRSEADCIDESVNTTALLVLLSDLKLLKFHDVVAPESRGYLLDFRYPHATAVVANRMSGARWAIDPWPKRNGQRPDTLPIAVWLKGG
jgi:hypothetical protein